MKNTITYNRFVPEANETIELWSKSVNNLVINEVDGATTYTHDDGYFFIPTGSHDSVVIE
jgi:hypothetical protein